MRRTKRCFMFFSLVLVGLLFAVVSSRAEVTNGNFETGNLSGWSIQGNVEVLQGSNFYPRPIPVPEGEYFVLLSTGPGDSDAPDGSPYLDADENGQTDLDETLLSQTFSVSTLGRLCFYWAWLTAEEDPVKTPPYEDDIFYVVLDGNIILKGSADKPPLGGGNDGSSPFPDVVTDNMYYIVNSPGGLTDGSNFSFGRSDFQRFCINIPSGSHTLQFIVADQGSYQGTPIRTFDSGLIIDDVSFTPSSPPPPPVTNVPTLTEWGILILVFMFALLGLLRLRKAESV